MTKAKPSGNQSLSCRLFSPSLIGPRRQHGCYLHFYRDAKHSYEYSHPQIWKIKEKKKSEKSIIFIGSKSKQVQ